MCVCVFIHVVFVCLSMFMALHACVCDAYVHTHLNIVFVLLPQDIGSMMCVQSLTVGSIHHFN